MTDWSKFQNSVENGLGLHALSYAVLPASAIYDQDAIRPLLRGVDDRSHIYFIGEVPKVEMLAALKIGNKVCISLRFANSEFREALFDIPEGTSLVQDEQSFFLECSEGKRFGPSITDVLSNAGGVPFEVLYIGQSYGNSGERKSLDRLRSHNTLQKIALRERSADYEIYILLFEISENTLFQQFKPIDDDDRESENRIVDGIEFSKSLTEAECVSIYEAAFIRYFEPTFNVQLKNSFPSTNLKCLQSAYRKDFAGVSAEVVFDKFPYLMFTSKIEKSSIHIANFNLHERRDRDFFFHLGISG